MHGPGPRRGRDHAAHEGDHAGPPVRADGRHGPARRDRARATTCVIIEDAAQAHGATYRGRRAGQFGPAMFSLYATKNLMTGEGGFATTDDDGLADRLRLYRNHGMRRALLPRRARDELQADRPRGRASGSRSSPRLDERTERAATERGAPHRAPGRVPDPGSARGPRARLAPVHDALPRRAGARRRGAYRARRRAR